MMTRKQFSIESQEYYKKHGSAKWNGSIYQTGVTQKTHNETIAKNLKFADMYYAQYVKNENGKREG